MQSICQSDNYLRDQLHKQSVITKVTILRKNSLIVFLLIFTNSVYDGATAFMNIF